MKEKEDKNGIEFYINGKKINLKKRKYRNKYIWIKIDEDRPDIFDEIMNQEI